MTSLRWGAVSLAIVALVGCGAGEPEQVVDPDDPCSAASIAETLANAGPGDVVVIGDCTVTGAFVVPSGVGLRGGGIGQTTIVAPSDEIAVELVPGTDASSVSDLTIESSGRAGIVAIGAGAADIDTVQVDVALGIGIGIEDVTALSISNTVITGPVTAANADEASRIDGPDTVLGAEPWLQTASHGLILVRTTDAALVDVTVSGLAFFGATFVDAANTTWTGGGAPDNLRVGLDVTGGSADLVNLDLCGTLAGTLTAASARSGQFSAEAAVTSRSLSACDSEGFGLFHDEAVASHTDLRATDNDWIGVWVGNTVGPFTIEGQNTNLSRNVSAGIGLHTASGVVIADALIDDTVVGPSGSAGDGISAFAPAESFEMRNLSLSGNERAGIFIDLDGGALDRGWFDNVTVEAAGTANGVVVNNGTLTANWDMGIERLGAAIVNDDEVMTSSCSSGSSALVCTGTSGFGLLFDIGPFEAVAPNSLIDEGLSPLIGRI